ncbi:ABC transporter permease [Falsigemmobacter faecalis]|uniref:Iron ABC transporter permease n=1 Tax=Falsigemmobacter faecalis TaxID=2488730 RepID=A0A3P3DCY3_9RHOB|nr:iron ABC transporter permease [Falsigemmobacter faecalis]RRH72185.1 iron ABC transporter permease [Falsigemmobacter faecalis]
MSGSTTEKAGRSGLALRLSGALHRRLTLPPRPAGGVWFFVILAIAALVLAPVLALLWQASRGSVTLWSHLMGSVLPHALGQTLILMGGVGVLVALSGTLLAWAVTAWDFRGRRLLEWGLLLPLAVPTYIVAYAYLDLLHPIGPVQEFLRQMLGYTSPRQFRLPDLRSMPGAIVLLSLVLFPYVYLPVRAMFMTQAANLLEVSRTLGLSRRQAFWRVAVPSARPAIAVGVSLALMEVLNDIGASEFLGVRSLTISVYTTWVTRSDLPGAAQIALAMLLLVVALVSLERWARRNQRYSVNAQRARMIEPLLIRGPRAWGMFALAALPMVFGFLIPAGYLAAEAVQRFHTAGLSPQLLREAGNSFTISALATLAVLICGVIIACGARLFPSHALQIAQRISGLGYAMPGTVLAIGILTVSAGFDRSLDAAMQSWFGVSTGLLLIGSGMALGYAYLVRFLGIASGSTEAGLTRFPRSYDHAARSMGRSAAGTVFSLHLPLSRSAIAAGGLLVFVDCMKELSATLLLRPLNFETLATHLYGEAARGTYEEASIAALAIVAVGILPVILLARVGGQARRRAS